MYRMNLKNHLYHWNLKYQRNLMIRLYREVPDEPEEPFVLEPEVPENLNPFVIQVPEEPEEPFVPLEPEVPEDPEDYLKCLMNLMIRLYHWNQKCQMILMIRLYH
jgi:hypothetical protein